MTYDADDDVLEAYFEVFDDAQARALPLNDSVIVYSNRALTRVWGIKFYSYNTLLAVGETALTSLRDFDEIEEERIIEMLQMGPVTLFLDFFDADESIARVLTPHVRDLLRTV